VTWRLKFGFTRGLQWRAETQLCLVPRKTAPGRLAWGMGLYLDLAVGTHPHGAETWEDGRELFAHGASLGRATGCVFTGRAVLGACTFLIPQAMRRTGYRAISPGPWRSRCGSRGFCGSIM
jgi:4-alpha-glucanotransferase